MCVPTGGQVRCFFGEGRGGYLQFSSLRLSHLVDVPGVPLITHEVWAIINNLKTIRLGKYFVLYKS